MRRSALYRAAWEKAMAAAVSNGARAEYINERTYAVPSRSKETCGKHLVTLDEQGRIADCSDCKGWEIFATALADGIIRTPCFHAGAVARRLVRERTLPKARGRAA